MKSGKHHSDNWRQTDYNINANDKTAMCVFSAPFKNS